MHETFLVDEIARRIAGQLFDRDDKFSSLSLSLTCRTLSDPVLDVLWKWQTDLVTLFKVFPPDVWEVNNIVGLVSTSPVGHQLVDCAHKHEPKHAAISTFSDS
jgi:hypothetical protein